MIKKALMAMVMAISLISCSQTVQGIDTAIQTNLPRTCALGSSLHDSFLLVAAVGNLKESTVRKEKAAWEGLDVICRDPSSVTTATALVKAAEAYLAIVTAMREAKRAEG